MSSPRTYALVSGVVPPTIAAAFSYFLPRVMRWLSQYMGANTHSSLDRIVVARYFSFMFVSNIIIFTLIGVIYSEYFLWDTSLHLMNGYFIDSVLEMIVTFRLQRVTLDNILENLGSKQPKYTHASLFKTSLPGLPARMTRTYVDQSTFWLTWFPYAHVLLLGDDILIFLSDTGCKCFYLSLTCPNSAT